LTNGVTVLSYTTASQLLSYNAALTIGYYVLVAAYVPININYIRITFQSDAYACPYLSTYPDFYSNFQPCTTSVATNAPGYPCLVYNAATQTCTQCVVSYVLVNSTCTVNTTCPAGQYFHFGSCYNASTSCATFDPFTGYCLTCVDPLNYVVNGQCVPNPALIVNCTARQYVINNKCFDVSAVCATFNSTNGNCLTCVANYTLNNGACFPAPANCSVNQYVRGNVCYNIPANCPSFNNVTGACIACAQGYYVNNGQCVQIICPTGQVPSKYGFFCIAVSPLCGNYDQLTGNCLTCAQADYIVSNGACVQTTSPIAGCAERQALGYGPCVNAQANCQSYNLVTGNCDQCVAGWFKDFTGVCSLQNGNNCLSD
jgi:hypothetical protein